MDVTSTGAGLTGAGLTHSKSREPLSLLVREAEFDVPIANVSVSDFADTSRAALFVAASITCERRNARTARVTYSTLLPERDLLVFRGSERGVSRTAALTSAVPIRRGCVLDFNIARLTPIMRLQPSGAAAIELGATNTAAEDVEDGLSVEVKLQEEGGEWESVGGAAATAARGSLSTRVVFSMPEDLVEGLYYLRLRQDVPLEGSNNEWVVWDLSLSAPLALEQGGVGTEALANGSVTTAKLADGCITSEKLAPELAETIGVPVGTSEQFSAHIVDLATTVDEGVAQLAAIEIQSDQWEVVSVRARFTFVTAHAESNDQERWGTVDHMFTYNTQQDRFSNVCVVALNDSLLPFAHLPQIAVQSSSTHIAFQVHMTIDDSEVHTRRTHWMADVTHMHITSGSV
jgi:hypothetical protein